MRKPGGAHTSRTMLLADLRAVLASCPATASPAAYREAIVERNVAGKASLTSRERTHRYLRELYGLDVALPAFRALRRLWDCDVPSQPVMALLVALSRDAAFAATIPGVVPADPGQAVTSDDLADVVERTYPGAYSDAIRNKIGRNALSSWQQGGYLARRSRREVVRADARPGTGALAMALVLASADGRSGQRLFEADIVAVLDSSRTTLHDRAHDGARKGWLDYRSRGSVTEVDLTVLTAEPEDTRMPLTEMSPA